MPGEGGQPSSIMEDFDFQKLSDMSLKDVETTLEAMGDGFDPTIQVILEGAKLPDLLPIFKKHNIDMGLFLNLTDSDLINLGIPLSQTRAQLLNAIKDFHLKDFGKDSIQGQKLIEPFTMQDSVAITANIAKHLQIIEASLNYVTREVEKGPILLPKQQDMQFSTVLLIAVRKSQILSEMISLKLHELEKGVGEIRRKDNLEDPDYISSWTCKTKKSSNMRVKIITAAAIGGLLFIVWKNRDDPSKLIPVQMFKNGIAAVPAMCRKFW